MARFPLCATLLASLILAPTPAQAEFSFPDGRANNAGILMTAGTDELHEEFTAFGPDYIGSVRHDFAGDFLTTHLAATINPTRLTLESTWDSTTTIDPFLIAAFAFVTVDTPTEVNLAWDTPVAEDSPPSLFIVEVETARFIFESSGAVGTGTATLMPGIEYVISLSYDTPLLSGRVALSAIIPSPGTAFLLAAFLAGSRRRRRRSG